jgi:hypothetical protein
MKSRLVILLFAIVSIYVVCNRQQWKENNFYYDSDGYYKYLPALFVNHDLKHVYENQDNAVKHILDKYPLGVAFFELPLFLVAHSYCAITKAYPQDGYSIPYQSAGIASTIMWVILGLILLRLFLLRYFTDPVTAIVLLCIAFGTNLYTYTVFDLGMSHAFSFFLFAAILYCTDRLYATSRPKYIYLLALLLGWVVITRPVNIIVILLSILWQVASVPAFRARLHFVLQHIRHIIGATILFFLVVFIQLGYWKYATGQWIYYSYGNEGFNFRHPHIWQGLLSYRKGWLVYTPIAAISLAGLYIMWKKNKPLFPVFLLLLSLAIYITFSWKMWWYGGSFGCRPLIEYMAILALPLGYLVQHILMLRRPIAIATLSALGLLITLNIFQSYQYSLKIVHHDRMSRAYYWKIFGKTHIDFNAYEQYLMNEKEYWRSVEETTK